MVWYRCCLGCCALMVSIVAGPLRVAQLFIRIIACRISFRFSCRVCRFSSSYKLFYLLFNCSFAIVRFDAVSFFLILNLLPVGVVRFCLDYVLFGAALFLNRRHFVRHFISNITYTQSTVDLLLNFLLICTLKYDLCRF